MRSFASCWGRLRPRRSFSRCLPPACSGCSFLALFEDRAVTWRLMAAVGALWGVGFAGMLAPAPVARWIWALPGLPEIGFGLHALLVIRRSWRGDLVEQRRHLRGPFFALVAVYAVVYNLSDLFDTVAGRVPPGLASALAMALIALASAAVFLDAHRALFGAAPKPAAADGLDPLDRAALQRLEKVMSRDEAWRREGLTIAALAETVGAPERRLRRLINDHLGSRNFAAFVNARRIEAAKAALGDPARAHTTLAALAYELGFGSLGPFNRAFKEAAGQTPSEWRRSRLGEGSPNSENPDRN
jgi:AraC-like DNA-binding protein